MEHCINNAPLIAIPKSEKTWQVAQGNCNSWTCPRCGVLRAKKEYGRIVHGVEKLASECDILYFLTLTCRGKELAVADSESNYLKWTNRVLTTLRTDASRHGKLWHYVQVTERQKRGHPHSHIITTYEPDDLYIGFKDSWRSDANGVLVNTPVECLRSDYIEKTCVRAGLGNQYDISFVDSAAGVSRYVAKYLFKPTMFETAWKKGWKRVRYSQSFPALPERKTDAFVLLSEADWSYFRAVATVAMPMDEVSENAIKTHCYGSDILIKTVAVSGQQPNKV